MLLAFLLFSIALTGAQPTNKGMFLNCEWKQSQEDQELYNVTCKPGDLTGLGSTIDIRSGTTSLPIYALDVDLTEKPDTPFPIFPDYLNNNLSSLKILIVRGDKFLSFGNGIPQSSHGLTKLYIYDSIIHEMHEDQLKGFNQLQTLSFSGLETGDIHENAISGLNSLQQLFFTNCTLGELETLAINENPSLYYVSFKGNVIDEFSKESIKDVRTSNNDRKCDTVTLNKQQIEVPFWEFIDNTIEKIDKDAIQIELVSELRITGNNITRIKSKGIKANVGSAVCSSGKVIISDNAILNPYQDSFAIMNHARSSNNIHFDFTGNVIYNSRSSFLPSTFNFPKKGLNIRDNTFPCTCQNSGHSWFIPALEEVNDPLLTFYKKLWTSSSCFKDASSVDEKEKLSSSKTALKCHDGKVDLGKFTPDPNATEKPPTPQPHNPSSTAAPGSASHLSSAFTSLCVLVFSISAM